MKYIASCSFGKDSLAMVLKIFDKPVIKRDGTKHYGYSWCGGRCRWGTTEKLKTIDNYCKHDHQYIGIAYDEQNRYKRLSANKSSPIYELKMTEKDCLKYCYESGFSWDEDGIDLYSILDRVSCWCCCNKNLKELKNYYLYLPKYWDKLKQLQNRTTRPMKYNKYTVYDLEERFKKEAIQLKLE